MGLKDLIRKEHDTQFYFFSGKGGVGKTSVSAATALWFSQRMKKKILIISIDPAHSLSDSFKVNIGSEVKKLKKNLFAVEIDPKKAMEEYKEKLTPHIEKIEFLKGSGLEDTLDIAGMSPGIDEIAAFDKFLHYMNSKDYDIIIFDTAPTGHTLRFLSLPDVLDSWIGKIIKFRMRFANIANIVKKILPLAKEEEKPSLGVDQLEAMKKRIEEAKKIFSDPNKTHYNMVLIPEQMSILESERSLVVLKQYNISTDTIIVNSLIPENPKCKFCTEKRKIQKERLKTIQERFKGFKIIKLRMFKKEVRGFEMLDNVGKELYGQ